MKIIPSVLVLFCCCTLLAQGQTPAPSPISSVATPVAAVPNTQGLRVFTVGHSFHVWVGHLMLEIAQSAGIKEHQMGVMGLGGSTVLECWQIPDAKRDKQPPVNTAKQALTSGTVDVLTLSPIWMPDEGIDNFASLALQHNPNVRITVQEYWLPNDTYEPKYPLDVRKQPPVNHDAATIPELRKHYEAYNRDVEEYVKGVNKKLGKDVVLIVPVGEATLKLREKIVAGQAPGLKKQWQLYKDCWGHPRIPLQVLSAYCHYAVIYRRSPVGLPVPESLKKGDGAKALEKVNETLKGVGLDYQAAELAPEDLEKLNRLLQQIAWDTVTHHPMTGLTADAAK